MRIVAASAFSLLLLTVRCKPEAPPLTCPPGTKEGKDPGFGFEGVGFPAGGIACGSEDPSGGSFAFVAYREGTREEVAAKLVAHLAAAGWKERPLPAEVQKSEFDAAVAGQSPSIMKLFTKDGTQERRYARIDQSHVVLVELYKQDCAAGGATNQWCQ